MAIDDKEKAPVFFHCKRGSERTGVMAAIYCMKYKGMSLDDAFRYVDQGDLKWIWRPFVYRKLKQYAAVLENEK